MRRWYRALVLGAGATLAATVIVGRLAPRRPLDPSGCGMDASFTLFTLSAWFLMIHGSSLVLRMVGDRIDRRPHRRGAARPITTPRTSRSLRP